MLLIALDPTPRVQKQQQSAAQAPEQHGARLRNLMERLLDIIQTNYIASIRKDRDVLDNCQLIHTRIDVEVIARLRWRIAQIRRI